MTETIIALTIGLPDNQSFEIYTLQANEDRVNNLLGAWWNEGNVKNDSSLVNFCRKNQVMAMTKKMYDNYISDKQNYANQYLKCDKIAYQTKHEAREEARQLQRSKGRKVTEYICQFCNVYHLTSVKPKNYKNSLQKGKGDPRRGKQGADNMQARMNIKPRKKI